MMHCDGANGGTTFTDVSSEGGNTAQTCAANGNAQTKTDQFKFGTASAYFDGTGDYVAKLLVMQNNGHLQVKILL